MNDPQNLSISFTGAQLDYLYRALGRCPADEVELLRDSIRRQISMQQAPQLPPGVSLTNGEAPGVGASNGSGVAQGLGGTD